VYANAFAVSNFFHLNTSNHWLILLSFSAWIIYLTDHLFDIKLNPSIHSERHQFIFRHSKKIILLIAILFLSCLIILPIPIPPDLLKGAILTGSFSILYFFFLLRSKEDSISLKEPAVAFVYGLGIYSIPLIQTQFNLNILFVYIAFTGITFQNLLLNSILDIRRDFHDRQPTVVLQNGLRNAVNGFRTLSLILILFCMALLIFRIHSILVFTYAVMSILNYLLFVNGNDFKQRNTRSLSEMIFWLPGIAALIYL